MKNLLYLTLFATLLFAAIPSDAQSIKTVAGSDSAGYTGDGNAATIARLSYPAAVRCDRQGNMYIADQRNHVVRKVSPQGTISTVAGTGVVGYTQQGVPATAALLSRPSDITFDAEGNMYIADAGNNIICKVTPKGILTVNAGIGSDGHTGDGGPATAAQIHNPIGLVFDKKGNLYFSADGNYVIREIDTAGNISSFAGTGMSGNSGDSGPAAAATIGLTGYLAIGPYGELYIPDYANNVVRKVDTLGKISTIAGNGSMGNCGDGGPATAACINSPYAVIIDSARSLYISEAFGYVIRKVDSFGNISTIAGTGMNGFSGDGNPATAAQFDANLNCSAMDAAGNLFIADPNNNRIRRITYNSTGINEVNRASPNVAIYPNPAQNELFVKADETITNIDMMDIEGKRYSIQWIALNKSRSGNISSLPAGMYLVRVNGVYAGRFVKE